jgi:hypothetical protein
MVLFKENNITGTVSVTFIHSEKKDIKLHINKININLNNGSNPIDFYKINGFKLVDGEFFDIIFRKIKKEFFVFFDKSYSIGMYKWSSETNIVTKV